jgi:hypothetical protein
MAKGALCCGCHGVVPFIHKGSLNERCERARERDANASERWSVGAKLAVFIASQPYLEGQRRCSLAGDALLPIVWKPSAATGRIGQEKKETEPLLFVIDQPSG